MCSIRKEMPEKEKVYKITDEFRELIVNFLLDPFDGTIETIKLLQDRDSFTEDEINQVVTLLGRFPAYNVYTIISKFKEHLKIEEVEPEK